jgi:hypothetical protein
MQIVIDEILAEKLRRRPNRLYIMQLQKLMDKEDELSLESFRDTGKYIPANTFKNDYNRVANLHPHCVHVIRYIGGFFIEVLNNGDFFVNLHDHEDMAKPSTLILNTNLNKVEDKYWKEKVQPSLK